MIVAADGNEIGQVFGWISANMWVIWVFGAMIAGSIGGAFKAISKENEKRHERKMERMRLRYGQVGATPSPQPQAAPAPTAQDRLRRQTTEALKAHKAVNDRWLAYELDVARLIDYPAMTDVREPLTSRQASEIMTKI